MGIKPDKKDFKSRNVASVMVTMVTPMLDLGKKWM